MTSNVETCKSDHAVFEFARQPKQLGTGQWELVDVLQGHCPDCGKYASVVVSQFDEAWLTRAWNAHHAHQMAQQIADHPAGTK